MRKAELMLAGFAATAASGGAGFTLGLFFAFGCSGTDVSTPSDSVVCTGWTGPIVLWAGTAATLAAPFAGMVVSLQRDVWRPLLLGCAAAAAVLVVLLALLSAAV